MLPPHLAQVKPTAMHSIIGAPSDLAATLTQSLKLRPRRKPASVLLCSTDDELLREALCDAAPGVAVTVHGGQLADIGTSHQTGSFDAVALVGDMLSRLLSDSDASDAAAVRTAHQELGTVMAAAHALLAPGGALYVDALPDGTCERTRAAVPVSTEPALPADVTWKFAPNVQAGTNTTTMQVRIHGEPEVSTSRTGLLVGKAQIRDAAARAGFVALEAIHAGSGYTGVLQGYVAKTESKYAVGGRP